jgi:lysophospholipase L1-like esterase
MTASSNDEFDRNSENAPRSSLVRKGNGGWLVLFFAVVLMSFVSAFFFCMAHNSRTNTLYENGRWVSTKPELSKGVVGAVAYVITRMALRGGTLDLGAWHGYQEVLFKEPLDVKRVSCDVKLDSESWLAFVFNKGEGDFNAVLLSRDAPLDTAYLTVDVQGEFKSVTPLDAAKIDDDDWHRLELVIDDDRGGFEFYLDGKLVTRADLPILQEQIIGFRGGQSRALIDNVRIELRDADRVILESFEGGRGFISSLFVVATAVLLLSGMLFFFVRRWKGARKAAFVVVITSIQLVLASAAWWWVDHSVLAYRYPDDVDYFEGLVNRDEKPEEVAQRLRDTYGVPNPDAYRIMILGSSQTWGAGVRNDDETFAHRIEKELNRHHQNNGVTYEIINTGISGADSSNLFPMYQAEWLAFKPQLVVVNLSSNDYDQTQFVGNLDWICRENEQRQIKTLFVLEPNSIEDEPEVDKILRLKHEDVRTVAKRYNVPVVEMHDYLQENHQRGFLWWDYVHLTSYGHSVFADRLLEEIEQVIATERQPEGNSQ